MIKGNSEVEVCDGSDKSQMFSRGWEQAEMVAMDLDDDRQDRGDFYSGRK